MTFNKSNHVYFAPFLNGKGFWGARRTWEDLSGDMGLGMAREGEECEKGGENKRQNPH